MFQSTLNSYNEDKLNRLNLKPNENNLIILRIFLYTNIMKKNKKLLFYYFLNIILLFSSLFLIGRETRNSGCYLSFYKRLFCCICRNLFHDKNGIMTMTFVRKIQNLLVLLTFLIFPRIIYIFYENIIRMSSWNTSVDDVERYETSSYDHE